MVRADPAGFLKVSALGIEEQRVRVTIDFSDPPEAWAKLGHDYKRRRALDYLERSARPDGAGERLVPKGDQWAVFADENGRAKIVAVTVGHETTGWPKFYPGSLRGTASCCILATGLLMEAKPRSGKGAEGASPRAAPRLCPCQGQL